MARTAGKASARSPRTAKPIWWQQETGVTWPALYEPDQHHWIKFVKDVGTTNCDRGILYHYGPTLESKADAVEYYHRHGMKVSAFLSINDWKPDKANVADLIRRMRRFLDDGCDGVHLDMFVCVNDPVTNVHKSDTAVRAVEKLRDAIHAYPRRPKAIFTGNAWILDSTFGPSLIKICDVGWIESYGHDDLELVRISRVSRSIDGYTKPIWYHWQPDDDEQERSVKLNNLGRALYASCMMEGAIFLCNYRYPVPVLSYDASGEKFLKWIFYDINKRWQEGVVAYAKFAKRYAKYFRDVEPVAPVLVAFDPEQITPANKAMTLLLKNNIPFNVHVFGKWPFEDVSRFRDFDKYPCVITPDNAKERKVVYPTAKLAAGDIIAGNIPGIHDFCRVEGSANVVTRMFSQPGRLLVHMKQHGYTDQADALPEIGPLSLEVRSERKVRRATCLSPDRAGEAKALKFRQHGTQVRLTIPRLEYYNLIVLET